MPLLLTLFVAGAAYASPQNSAKDALKAIHDAEASVRTDAQVPGFYQKEKALAADAVRNIDAATVDPKDAYDYAKLFDILGQHKDVCDLVQKYLATNPSPTDKFDAQMLMMGSCSALGEGAMLDQTLADSAPASARQAETLAAYAGPFGKTIAKAKGMEEALAALDGAEKKMIYDDPVKAAREQLTAFKSQLQAQHKDEPSYKLPSDDDLLKQIQKRIESLNLREQLFFVAARAAVLKDANRQEDGLVLFDKFIALHPDFDRAIKAKMKFALIGSSAPELVYNREYGDFKSLAAWKGKVVVVDTFAHWCGPCKQSFPDMRKMYDDLHSKGLELVGVTSYFGFFAGQKGDENGLAPAVEYAKMARFMKDYNIDWPVIFAPQGAERYFGNPDFVEYGVVGIPTVILIGRDGKVIATEAGYGRDGLTELRKKVEAALLQN